MTCDYHAVLACYLSGQMSEAQWQDHLADPLFALWLVRRGTKT